MSNVNGQYVSRVGWQPVCVGCENGQLKWELVRKQDWHLKMYPVPYSGDFRDMWWELSGYEKKGIKMHGAHNG